MSDRKSPSGELSSVKGTIAIAATAVATTAAATASGTFVLVGGGSLPVVGNVVSLSPQANLTAAIAVAWARVVSTGVIVIGFTNTGASTSQAAVTFDADCQLQ